MFCRNELLIGTQALGRLQASRVVIVGIGAVGAVAAEALARAGVGFIRAVDCDLVKESDFNRNILATRETLGTSKVEALRQRIEQIGLPCKIEAMNIFAAQETFEQIFSDGPEVLIDAIDSLNPKVALLEAAVARIPHVISCFGAANKLDPFKVRVALLKDTRVCPLARRVRKKIKDRDALERVICIYSEEQPQTRPVEKAIGEDTYARGRPRQAIGSLMCITALFGLVAAREAIRALCAK